MRIIAGKFKGRSLITMKDKSIRPTTDRVKESIFNLLQGCVEDANVLDLFAGSGALGIEALSRGAHSVTFADRSNDSIETVNTNLKKVSGKINVIRKDFLTTIDYLSARKEKFDLIFLDPPYKQGLDKVAIDKIDESGILAEDGIIVVERSREDEPLKLSNGFRAVNVRDYGSVTVMLVQKTTACAVTGTFDPFTLGHKFLVSKALELFDEVHVVILDNPEKKTELSVDKRLKLIETSTRRMGGVVKATYYDGLTIDYCKENDIQYIIRGIRNETDYEYEKAMASWNKEHGNVETLLIPAEDAEISSTLVREKIKNGDDLVGLVDEEILLQLRRR